MPKTAARVSTAHNKEPCTTSGTTAAPSVRHNVINARRTLQPHQLLVLLVPPSPNTLEECHASVAAQLVSPEQQTSLPVAPTMIILLASADAIGSHLKGHHNICADAVLPLHVFSVRWHYCAATLHETAFLPLHRRLTA